jgi:hypothetical protein
MSFYGSGTVQIPRTTENANATTSGLAAKKVIHSGDRRHHNFICCIRGVAGAGRLFQENYPKAFGKVRILTEGRK